MTALLFVLGTICGVVASTSSFSLLYMGPSSHNSISSSPLLLEAVPSAQHVADIICRLNGQPPILLEDLVDLPHLDILHGKHAPIVLELHNADLPKEAVSILQIHSNEAGVSAPSLQAVAASLLAHGTPLDSHVAATSDIADLLALGRPVVIIHHETNRRTQRRLASVVILPPTEFQISTYQITLWSAVLLFFLLLGGVCAVVRMEVIPDSLLFAKFQSSRTGRSD